MPPVPYWADESESLIFTSAMESKIGVLMTLLLIGELVETPSSNAFENGMLPFTDTPPIPGLEDELLFCGLPRVPGNKTINCCQSGVPTCGRVVRLSFEIVVESSAVAVSSRGAADSWIVTVCVDCPTFNSAFRPVTPVVSVMGPRCTDENPSFLNVIK